MHDEGHASIANREAPDLEPGTLLPLEEGATGAFDEWLPSLPISGGVELFDIHGRDDRQPVENTGLFPWRAICHLWVVPRSGAEFEATGWIAGPRTVITAGHVVHPSSGGGFVRSIEISPGKVRDQAPHGRIQARHFRTTEGWAKTGKDEFDYGAILLPPPHPALGHRLGYFGFANRPDRDLEERRAVISGYPVDKANVLQKATGVIEEAQPRRLRYEIDTENGQSGSPLWIVDSQQAWVVGIHTEGSAAANSGLRISRPVFENIRRWKHLSG